MNDKLSYEPRFVDRLERDLLLHGNAVILVTRDALDGLYFRAIRSSDLHDLPSGD